jgi:tRNA dimethylallyltransferase
VFRFSEVEKKERIIIIAGPTASGKSSLAIELADRFHGEIVNVDSMQVYRGMDIGTAKPSPVERKGIPHHLIDVVYPDEEFNAAIYRSLAVPAINEIQMRGKVCFVVGGTGLYIKTLTGGLLACPPVHPPLREELRKQSEQHGPGFLHKQLERLDPEISFRIHPHDKVRIMRALEIITLTGEPLSRLMQRHAFQEMPFHVLKIYLQISREELYHDINERSRLMVDKGLIEETKSLLNKGYSQELKPMQALGYRHAIEFLTEKWTLEEMVEHLQRDTRRYAKRQLTWFGADPEATWLQPDRRDDMSKRIKAFLAG